MGGDQVSSLEVRSIRFMPCPIPCHGERQSSCNLQQTGTSGGSEGTDLGREPISVVLVWGEADLLPGIKGELEKHARKPGNSCYFQRGSVFCGLLL